MKQLIFLLLWALILPTISAQETDRPEPLYVIQPNDMLEIFVWKEPELTRKVLVRPDGRISFPLVQDLQAAGISPGELKRLVEKKLSEFLSAPEVTIIVEAIQSYRIYVLGKVQKPGGLNNEKAVTVLQALALAGGFQDYAKDDEITILRTIGNEHIVFNFNYRDVIKGRRAEQNILLRSGDVVVVP
ncbi:MAG: polysaccharide biosynthesis/export family protein [Acidobacteria bacterium]|nr:polysaccharide biosynthesis/export family protein [Acidobacteriota bacterium]